MNKQISFNYELFGGIDELNAQDANLLREARRVTQQAYAPYSSFFVGAVALFENGDTVSGTNQENASYPVGICAERVLLASAAMLHRDEPISAMAISYNNLSGKGSSDKPVSPCGMCRQSLAEYGERTGKPIRLILSGMEGEVIVVANASQLLPLGFGSGDLS